MSSALLGEAVPECDVAATISAVGTSVFEGVRVELSADLRTCDGTTWEGLFDHRFVDPWGAVGEITATADVVVELPDASGTASTDVAFIVGGCVFYQEADQSVTAGRWLPPASGCSGVLSFGAAASWVMARARLIRSFR